VISPSAANGLQACSDAQIALSSTLPASCPPASKIGTVTVHTPILNEPLEGQLFLGQPECSPCSNADAQAGRLARGLLQVHSDRYGITLKVPGRISIDPSTGQLIWTSPPLLRNVPLHSLQFYDLHNTGVLQIAFGTGYGMYLTQ